jgi:hypothetical protein
MVQICDIMSLSMLLSDSGLRVWSGLQVWSGKRRAGAKSSVLPSQENFNKIWFCLVRFDGLQLFVCLFVWGFVCRIYIEK